MMDVGNWLAQTWSRLVHELTHLSLPMALWLGLALLTIALLILMGTRWGQVKPVWKCVALSLLAHVLLGGYAYGTKLIFTAPSRPVGEPIVLKLVDSADSSRRVNASEGNGQPWEKFGETKTVKMEPVSRMEPDLEPVAKRTRPNDQELVEHLVQPQPAPRSLNQSTEKPLINTASLVSVSQQVETPAYEIGGKSLDVQPIQLQRQKQQDPQNTTAPSTETMARMDVVDSPLKRTPPRAPADMVEPSVDELLEDLAAVVDRTVKPSTAHPDLPPAQTRQSQPRKPDSVPIAAAAAPPPRRRLADGKQMPELYSRRAPDQRKASALALGGSLDTEKAVEAALQWLSHNQEVDGRWSAIRFGAGRETLVLGHDRRGAGANADTGITGLSLLAFLGAGNSHLEGKYRETVQKGLEYLLRNQAANGNLAGDARLFAKMYCHAIASLAVTEALALTGDSRLLDAANKAVGFSVASQNRTDGGWRYQPGDRGDMSQFGWQVMALKSAELGGVGIPSQTKILTERFLQQSTTGAHGGLAGYKPGHPPTATMTAEALLCRYFIHGHASQATAEEAIEVMLANLPGNSEYNLYYWYYGTLAMFHAGGPAWEKWNRHLSRTLVTHQVPAGEFAGSWEPKGVWCGYGGRVYSTAMATLCLEVYYRYSRKR